MSCSIINKVFDLLPPVLIGLAVDVVVQQDSSWLAALGATTVPSQLIVLALLSFLVFIGIVAWTLSRRRNESFEEAARLPFAADEAATRLGGRHE